jgi:hypothetical protein
MSSFEPRHEALSTQFGAQAGRLDTRKPSCSLLLRSAHSAACGDWCMEGARYKTRNLQLQTMAVSLSHLQNEEDDATFWSRLVAEPDRPQAGPAAPLAPRAARTKQQQQQQPDSKSASPTPQGSRQLSQQYSDEPPTGAGASRPKPKKARRSGGGGGSRASDKPGAPVEGAVLRIDQWPLEPAQDGKVCAGCGWWW